MSAGLEASTVTPGMTAPEVSRTTPAIFPESAWAHTVAGSSMHPTSRSHADLTIVPPFQTSSRSERRDPDNGLEGDGHDARRRAVVHAGELPRSASLQHSGVAHRLCVRAGRWQSG